MSRIQEHHLRFAAWEWGEHGDRYNRWFHALSNLGTLSASCLLLGNLRVAVPGAPLGITSVSVATLFFLALVLYFAFFDFLSVVIVSAVLAVTTGAALGLDPLAGLPGWARVAVPLALFNLLGLPALLAHRVYFDQNQAHMSNPPGGMLVRTLHVILFGAPTFVLFALLDRGHRPGLREAIERRSFSYFGPRPDADWTNWSRVESCTPQVIVYPTSAEEVAELVRRAKLEGKQVRVTGTAFSWSGLVPTDQLLLNLRNMRAVDFELDHPAGPRVHLQAGATGRDFHDRLAARGYALPTNVVMETVSWAGMVSVGAHGSGRDLPTLSDYVEAIELVDGHGRLRRFSTEVDGPEVMNALRVSLGVCGVITRVSVRVEPIFHVRLVDSNPTVEETLARLPELVRGHEYCDIYWFPHNETTWTRTWDRTTAPPSPRRRQRLESANGDRRTHWSRWVCALQAGFSRYDSARMRKNPALTPELCRRGMRLFKPRDVVVDILDATHYRQGIENYRVGCVEFAFAVDERFDSVRRAWDLLMEVFERFAAQGRYPLNMTVNLRFVRGSGGLLSPASCNTRTCYIEALGDIQNEGWADLRRELGAAWMTLPRARVHWGKEFEDIPGIIPHLRRTFGGELEAFLAVRERLELDPEDRFVNPLTRRVLYGDDLH